MKEEPLLVPAIRAARKLSISRWTLNRLIDAKEVRAVWVGSRRFIPQGEIERLVNGLPAQASEPKPAAPDPISSEGANSSSVLLAGEESSIDRLIAGYGDFLHAEEARTSRKTLRLATPMR